MKDNIKKDESYDLSKEEEIDEKRKNDDSSVEELNDRIVGGTEVEISLYPYHVGYGTNCGGAIIDRKWVMSAAHCGYV